jgi:hypothetical protein
VTSPKQDFNCLYKDVSDSIAAATKEISGLKVDHQDGKKELTNMMEKLSSIQSRFDGELQLLEEHAEWDKFTMAFFGETNAGKSTIIESLRILFNEDSRQELLKKNDADLVKFEQALAEHVNQVREEIHRLLLEYAEEIESIKQSAICMTQVLQEESALRIKRKLWVFALSGTFFGGAVVGAVIKMAGV